MIKSENFECNNICEFCINCTEVHAIGGGYSSYECSVKNKVIIKKEEIDLSMFFKRCFKS